jgi:cytochrome c553
MSRFLSWIIALTFLVLAVGCGGGKAAQKDIPINTNPTKKIQEAPPPKEPRPEQKWLSEKCTQCHESSELPGLLDKVGLMSATELEAKLRTMVKGDLRLSDEDISTVMGYYTAWKTNVSGGTTPPEGTVPSDAPAEPAGK